MSLFARIALGLALLLPITGYVVGSLVAADPAPAQHSPIVLKEAQESAPAQPGVVDPDGDPSASPSTSPSTSPSSSPSPSPSRKPSPGPTKKSQPDVVRPGAIDPDDDDYDDIDDDDLTDDTED